MQKTIIFVILAITLVIGGLYISYQKGYQKGYKVGYADALESTMPPIQVPADTVQTVAQVKTETVTTVRPKTQQEIKNNAPAVVIETKSPVVQATVNGQKYDFKPQSEVLQTGVQTTATIAVKVPERRWKIGIGMADNKKPAYMLSAPIKGAVGAWVAGTKGRVMGGVTVSF